jgi:hypothetical protein
VSLFGETPRRQAAARLGRLCIACYGYFRMVDDNKIMPMMKLYAAIHDEITDSSVWLKNDGLPPDVS